MGQSFEKRDDRGNKGRDVRGRSTRAKRGDVDVATVGYDLRRYIFEPDGL